MKNKILAFLFSCFCSYFLKGQVKFVDITEEAGVKHQFKVYEGMFGGGVAVFDINNDGFQDFFVTSGMNEDALYLNNGDGTFKNIYTNSGLEETKKYATQGVVSADVNRDGFIDLFITTITYKNEKKIIPRAPNLLFLNNGDMTFKNATKAFKLDQLNSFSTGASFGDVNADGFPDLYVGNYFLEYEGELSEINDATIVNASQTAKPYLLINKGGAYFEDEYETYDLNHRGFGFGALFTDFDNDGDQDLMVNHDFGYKAVPNVVLENKYPSKSYIDIAEEKNLDLKINSMTSAVGDYNNDGYFDYFFTNIKFNRFMVNGSSGKEFKDKTLDLGLHIFAISWGANFADFDHDGDLDLFVANGDLNPYCVPMVNFYFENDNFQFKEKAREVGVNNYGLGRGSVVFDMDNDGDLDLLVVNQEAVKEYPVESTTRLYRNDSEALGNWVKIALKGVESETQGIGSRVKIVVGNTQMMREVDGGGSSHLSQNSTIAHFGIGAATKIDSVIVTWVGGKKQILLNQNVNSLLTITEIESEKKPYLWYVAALGVVFLLAGIFLKFKK